jgi:hypothetical protein
LPIDRVASWAGEQLHKSVTHTVEAGGGRNLRDDAAAVDRIAAAKPATVLVFVRAWEAPLLDLQDFLASVRRAVGPACSIVVIPVGPGAVQPTKMQHATWSHWVGRIPDPALYMETGA